MLPQMRPVRTFDLTLNASGGSVTNNNGVAATGTITFSLNPSNNATVTINGVVFTFKTTASAATDIQIGASLAATLTTLAAALNASRDALLVVATYTVSSTVLTITYNDKSTGGNAFTIAASVATPSGATLSGATVAPFGRHSGNGVEQFVRLVATTACRVSFNSAAGSTSILVAANWPEVWAVGRDQYISAISESASTGKLNCTVVCN